MRRGWLLQTILPALACGLLSVHTLVAQTEIYYSDLSVNDGWTVLSSSDALASFGYDYSQDGIPPAPGGADTVGLKMIVNNSLPGGIDEVTAAVGSPDFSGRYRVEVDVWVNYSLQDSSAATEFAGVSVGHDMFAQGPFGATLLMSGDGGAGDDYQLYKSFNKLVPSSGQYALGNAPGANDNSNQILVDAFPGIDVELAAPAQGQMGMTRNGSAGFQWMTLQVDVDTEAVGNRGGDAPGLATFSLRSEASGNSVLIGTIDNSVGTAATMAGSVALTLSDYDSSTTSSPGLSFALFDNLRVTSLPNVEFVWDFLGDGVYDEFDLDMLVAAIISQEHDPRFDLNDDQAVTLADVDVWLAAAAQANGYAEPYRYGDADLDGLVDVSDFGKLNSNFSLADGLWSGGDFNASGIVDVSDFGLLNSSFNVQIARLGLTASAVPEPSSCWLFLLGSWCLGRLRRSGYAQ